MNNIALIRNVFLLSMSSLCAWADLITEFGFTADFSASYEAPGVTVSAFSNGPAITSISLDNDGQPPKSWAGENWTTSDDPLDAITSDSYVWFRVYAQPGISMSFTKLTLDVRPHGSGPQDFMVRVIEISSGSNFQMGSIMTHSDQTRFDDGRKTWETLSTESDSLEDLEGGYEIRIYGFDANQANREVLFDNIYLEGMIITVPEPSTFLLMSLSIGLLVSTRLRPQNR
jgi:hypothetical protein